MIPRRLRLHNFLSYRDCEVDFGGLHIATLSGKNGEGKSALLDGITWALWGEGRGRVEDDRIFLGEGEMRVELEFEGEGDVFRVIRKRTRGRSAGHLDLFHVDADGQARVLTGGTVRETQAELNRLVRMDAVTFMNSAFVAQGRADEFTRRNAGERKEVLRKVLGLERYEALASRANEVQKEAKVRLGDRERWLEETADALAGREAADAELRDVVAALDGVRSRLPDLEREATELRVAAAEHLARERAVAETGSRLDRLTAQIAERAKALATMRAGLEAAQVTLAGSDRVEADYARLTEARERDAALAAKETEARAFEQAIAVAERTLAEERARLESRAGDLDQRVTALTAVATALPQLREEERCLASERSALETLDATVTALREADAAARERAASLTAAAKQHRDRAQELKERQTMLEGAAGEPLCPVCAKPLSPDDVARVLDDFAAERRALGDRYRAAKADAAKAEAEAEGARDEARAVLAERESAEMRLRGSESSLQARIAEAAAAEQELPALTTALTETRETLANDRYGEEGRRCRDEAQRGLVALGFDPEERQRARRAVAEFAGIDEAYRELAVARERSTALAEQIAAGEVELGEREAECKEVEALLTEARAALEASTDVSGRLGEVEAALTECTDRAAQLAQQCGRLEERRATLEALEVRYEAVKDEIGALRDEGQVHGELAQAFGKNGVQAMLIDQAIPEIERIANAMLDRMTDGRIQVMLATQRQTARGSTVETLDIRISDELGTRDYEMYSGGEAFRVDFALRIALSRLLAARSGASLPTLIIDEGFGTQDQEGIDRLVEAINSVRDEFRLVLLVTHIEELRERFDRRIEVTKDPERGSIARVV